MTQWLDNIRQSDHKTKFRYFLIFTGISGIFVFSIWAITVRHIIESNATTAEIIKKPEMSFMEKISYAWHGITDRTANTVNFFQNKVSETHEITIDKNGQ